MTGRRSEIDAPLAPTFEGYIETTLDALLVFEACKQRVCPKIGRRLHDKERHLIRSGSIFVFIEAEAGIKRWTDGLVWSPSRILGNFLIYRELNKRGGNNAGRDEAAEEDSFRKQMMSAVADSGPLDGAALRRAKEKALVGSLTGSAKYKEDGLVKKTISLAGMHMITYYNVDDVLSGKLRTPSSLTEFAILEPGPEFLQLKMFRVPPLVEVGPDGIPRFRAENAQQEPVMTGGGPAQQLPVPHGGSHGDMSSLDGSSMPPGVSSSSTPQAGGMAGHPSSAASHYGMIEHHDGGAGRSHMPMLSPDASEGSPQRARSPMDYDTGRPLGPQRSKSGSNGSPLTRTVPLTVPGAGRYDPYRLPGMRRHPDERPHSSSGADLPNPNPYDHEASRHAVSYGAGHAPVPSYNADEAYRYAAMYPAPYAYGGMYAPHPAAGSPHAAGGDRPGYLPAPLAMPMPHYDHMMPSNAGGNRRESSAGSGGNGYDEAQHYNWTHQRNPSLPPIAVSPHQQHQQHTPPDTHGHSNRPATGGYQYHVGAGKMNDGRGSARLSPGGSSGGDAAHPQSAPPGQTVFSVPPYGNNNSQPSGLVASSPDEERWLHHQP